MVKNYKMSTTMKEMDTVERNIVYPKDNVTITFMDRN